MSASRWLRAVALTLMVGHPTATSVFAQTAPERLWLAGRYDRNHVVMYFSAVKFNGTVPADAVKIAEPKADAFFYPVGLPASYVSQLQKKTPRAERFSVGDRYDVLLDGGRVATITLDELVGFENDEQVGNDSYIGALGRVAPRDIPRLTKDYYVARRHRATSAGKSKAIDRRDSQAHLGREPVSADLEARMLPLLQEALAKDTTGNPQLSAANGTPVITLAQSFALADGSTRYYVSARVGSAQSQQCARVHAFVNPQPTLRVVSLDKSYCLNDPEAPSLLNVAHLGRGRTGLIVNVWGGDGRDLRLVEYRDGVGLFHLRIIQIIGAGE